MISPQTRSRQQLGLAIQNENLAHPYALPGQCGDVHLVRHPHFKLLWGHSRQRLSNGLRLIGQLGAAVEDRVQRGPNGVLRKGKISRVLAAAPGAGQHRTGLELVLRKPTAGGRYEVSTLFTYGRVKSFPEQTCGGALHSWLHSWLHENAHANQALGTLSEQSWDLTLSPSFLLLHHCQSSQRPPRNVARTRLSCIFSRLVNTPKHTRWQCDVDTLCLV